MWHATTPFTSVHDYNKLTFTWYASLKDLATGLAGTNSVIVGTSSNVVYVTWHKPSSSPFETCVYIGTDQYATGATTQQQEFKAIWAQFASRNIGYSVGGSGFRIIVATCRL